VSGSEDATIRIWDAHSRTVVVDLFEGHTDSVRSVAFSPDNTYIASGSSNGKVSIWDAQTGSMVGKPFKQGGGEVMSVAFSPNGTRLSQALSTAPYVFCECKAAANSDHSTPTKGQSGRWCSLLTVIVLSLFLVRIWDVQSGTAISGPFRHPNSPGMNSAIFFHPTVTASSLMTIPVLSTSGT
jgi:WD40 repeat protein